jgi:hypothetical protein
MATAKSQTLSSAPPHAADEFVTPSKLNFDLDNPRFVEGQFVAEEDVVRHLVDEADVNELVQSILSAGYVDYEPLIVLKKDNTVLEGNRRLAALRLIADVKLRQKLKYALPEITAPQSLPQTVRVRFVKDRSEARSFIGFKHINGPFKWDALAKARYAADWFKDGADIATISRTLGDGHNTVRRLVNGWYALKQAQDDGFDISKISKKTFSFSHLYTALTRASVREFLGIAEEDPSTPPQKEPIPKSHRQQLGQLMSWLYGQEQRNEPTLIQSQNPDLNVLSKVLGHPEARKMLLAQRDLGVAQARVEPASTRFEDALMRAAKQCEDANALSGGFDGDPTLVKVAEGLQRTARSLNAAMKDRVDARRSDED